MYNYDKDDNIIKVSDSKGVTADFTYDKAGNIIRCVRSDGTETTYAYDKKYNLTKLVNRKGDHIISSYSYEYDKEDRVIKETEKKDSKVIVTSFTYDKAGQLSGYIENTDGELKKTSYTYNAAGNRVSITKGGDEGTIKVTYNSDNQVVSEENSKTGDKIKYVYDENGNLIEKKSKGKTVIYEYDIENRLRSVSQGGQMLMAATYDGLGNKVFQMSRKFVEKDIEKDIEKEDEGSEGDDDGEDGEISGSWFDPDMFMYGAMQGGMKMSTSQSPSLMAAVGNKLSEIWEGITTFFTGDFKTVDIDELEGIIVPGTERGTFITYDLTYYLNDTSFNEYSQVMYQYGEGGDDKASYVYGAYDERISADLTNAAVAYVNDKAGSYTYLYDGQGNVTQNLLNGKEANSYYYDPFGNIEDGVEENDIIFGYNGEEYTEAAQLQYLRQRHYAPDMGAFLTQDAYRGDLYEPITQNRYTYAVNDPVNYNDPGGDKASRRAARNLARNSGSISNALNNLANAAKTASILNSLAVIEEAVNKVGWTTQYRVNNPGASQKDAEVEYYVDKGLKATVQANETLMQAVKNLQTGVECKANPPNNASPWGTRESAGKRREYKVPVEERPGVWAVGVEAGATVVVPSVYGTAQIVSDAKGKSKGYGTIYIQGEITKNMISKIVESLTKDQGINGGGGVVLNFVNANDINVYTEGTAQNIGFSTKNYSLSLTRYLYEGDYYYGYSVGVGYYTPDIEFGVAPNYEKLIEEIMEAL